MAEEMTHERCSELLRSYVSGDLAGDAAAAVRAHLEGCPDCRAEERAVALLTGAPEDELDDMERARLHRALSQELFAAPANAEVAPLSARPARGRLVRLAPALGAAAVLLGGLVVAGNVAGSLFGGGEDAEMGSSAGGGDVSEDADGGRRAGKRGAALDSVQPEVEAATGAGSGTQSTYDAAAPVPEFDPDAGKLTQEKLSAIGRDSALFKSFSDAYSAEDARQREGDFLRRLIANAGRARSQARDCARTLPPEETLLPAYGARGDYEGRRALILGFVTPGSDPDSLDRYLMWVWAEGSCTQPIDTLFENIAD